MRKDDPKIAAVAFQFHDRLAVERVIVELSGIRNGLLQLIRGPDRLTGGELPQRRADIAEGIGRKRHSKDESKRESQQVHVDTI